MSDLDRLFTAAMDINSGRPNVMVEEATKRADVWRATVVRAQCPCGTVRVIERQLMPSRCSCNRHIVFDSNDGPMQKNSMGLYFTQKSRKQEIFPYFAAMPQKY